MSDALSLPELFCRTRCTLVQDQLHLIESAPTEIPTRMCHRVAEYMMRAFGQNLIGPDTTDASGRFLLHIVEMAEHYDNLANHCAAEMALRDPERVIPDYARRVTGEEIIEGFGTLADLLFESE